MFLQFVVLLCVGCIHFMSSAATTNAPITNDCFPQTVKANKSWRYDSATGKTLGPKFDSDIESGVNELINYELSAHYTYLSMSYHFDQDEYHLPGFSKFFKEMAEEEHEHAQIFMKYQNKRGGRIRLNSISSPCKDGHWGNGTEAMKSALHLEQIINTHLLNLHALGDSKYESQFLDFLESNFLGEQVDSIKEISNYVHILQKIDTPLGEFQFDQLILGGACGRHEFINELLDEVEQNIVIGR